MSALAPTLESFFTERLIRQRQASPHTIAAYRDTMRLLLGFAARSSPTSNASGATRCAPATPAWRRFIRCFATPRYATPSTRR